MPRTITDAPLTTRAARDRLAVRHQPYWRGIEAGAALGYRKGKTGGMWMVRLQDKMAAGGYRQVTLGRADDALKAAGDSVLDYRAADAKAREWITRQHRIAAGLEPEPSANPAAPYSVADAVRDYLADYLARGGKALGSTKAAADTHILPALGALPVARLTRDKVKTWHRGLATTPARLRAKPGEQRLKSIDGDADAPRRRRSTANRLLTVLKAALNHARAEGKVGCSPDAWASVKPFREADKAKVRYLIDDEITRLVNACLPDFRELVTGALLSGCRYGELAAMTAGDFDPQAGTITVGRSKGGKPRHVALTDEGRAFFTTLAAGKRAGDRLFLREAVAKQATRKAAAVMKRVAWGKSDAFRFVRAACEIAKIEPPISFHDLRHTYASRLAMKGVPMGVIAAQLGHTDTRMTEKHYAHLSPSFVAETVRASFGTLGIVPGSNVTPIRTAIG